MLEPRGVLGERRIVDLNALIDEALNLAYHGARAQDRSSTSRWNAISAKHRPDRGQPQDITRGVPELFANGFYAITSDA